MTGENGSIMQADSLTKTHECDMIGHQEQIPVEFSTCYEWWNASDRTYREIMAPSYRPGKHEA
jgi:hypothetical protein